MTRKLFKNSNGQWEFNGGLIPAGKFYLQVIGNILLIKDGDDVIFRDAVTMLLRSDNSPYEDLATFIDECGEFFMGAVDNTDLIAAITASGASTFRKFEVEITRPANATVYSPNDVVADVTAAFKPILNVAKAAGAGVKIVRARIQTSDTGVAGTRFNLHLYKEAPAFIADNSPFTIAYANAVRRVGAIPIVMGTGNMSTVGMNDYNQVILNPTSRDVYWILETVSGFTPSANSTKFTISIDCELSN